MANLLMNSSTCNETIMFSSIFCEHKLQITCLHQAYSVTFAHIYLMASAWCATSIAQQDSKAMANTVITPLIPDSLPAEIWGDILVSRTHHLQINLLTFIKSLLLSLNYNQNKCMWLTEFLILSKLVLLLFLKLSHLYVTGPAYQVTEIEMTSHTP